MGELGVVVDYLDGVPRLGRASAVGGAERAPERNLPRAPLESATVRRGLKGAASYRRGPLGTTGYRFTGEARSQRRDGDSAGQRRLSRRAFTSSMGVFLASSTGEGGLQPPLSEPKLE